MADNETDALLKDLESRASKPKAAAAEDEGGDDIEAFLRSLEGADYVAPEPPAKAAAKPATKTKTADPLADQFAGLEAAPDAPMQKAAAKPPNDRDAKKAAKAAEKEAKAAEKEAQVAAKEAAKAESAAKKAAAAAAGELTGAQKAARIAKWTAVLVPLLAAWWVLGAYLANWVSAGWLVFLLATALVFGVPLALLLGVKKGRYIWWTAGTSALIAIGLVAPLPEASSNAMHRYGHWPASALAEVAGLVPSAPIVRANAAIGGWLGSWIFPKAEEDRIPQKLGTSDPLNPDDVPKPVPDPTVPVNPVPPTPENPPAPQPVVPQPVTPQPVAPQPVAPQPVAPQPVAPQPVAPQPVAPQPVAPQPVAPQPVAPQPVAPQPVTPPPPSPQPDPAPQPQPTTPPTTP